MRLFAGLSPELVSGFVERVTRPAEFGPALDRWKELAGELDELDVLALDDGGQVVELVAVGFRYLEPADDAATLSA